MKNQEPEQSPAYAGVDISKDALDVSLAGQGPGRYDNSATGITQLVKALKRLPQQVQVICEPSGGYERELLKGLWAAGSSQRGRDLWMKRCRLL
jgi:transposase